MIRSFDGARTEVEMGNREHFEAREGTWRDALGTFETECFEVGERIEEIARDDFGGSSFGFR